MFEGEINYSLLGFQITFVGVNMNLNQTYSFPNLPKLHFSKISSLYTKRHISLFFR